MKPNLDQGNPAAKRQNSPGPLPKNKRTNLAQTKPAAKPANILAPHPKNSESSTYRKNPTNTPPMNSSDDARIRREITTRSHPVHHSRKGR